MTLEELNNLNQEELKTALNKCCGSSTWTRKMCLLFPVVNKAYLFQKSDEIWYNCEEKDFIEAFTHHPKIGDTKSLKEKFANTSQWASGEQSGVNYANDEIITALEKGNIDYENKFGYIFIVCATGKSAEEMLILLLDRLPNDSNTEIQIAMEEQNKITKIRLKKLLS